MNTKKLLGYMIAILMLALPLVFSGCGKVGMKTHFCRSAAGKLDFVVIGQ